MTSGKLDTFVKNCIAVVVFIIVAHLMLIVSAAFMIYIMKFLDVVYKLVMP